MPLGNNTVDLIVTSPPYWNIKDYGSNTQIGYNSTYEHYIEDLNIVWKECFRVLKEGCRLCVNVGDQFVRTNKDTPYHVKPIHSDIIDGCKDFDYLGCIIWQKLTTCNTSGGACIMGSYPYPPNGLIKMDFEYILIFRKSGKKETTKEIKEKSVLTKEEWLTYFTGHWNIKGERQKDHPAVFPLEIPYRLIKMFSYVGDLVLDPFAGSGTTAIAAIKNKRGYIMMEKEAKYVDLINKRIADYTNQLTFDIFEEEPQGVQVEVKPQAFNLFEEE